MNVCDEIQPYRFIDDGVFATKKGETGILFRLRPQDSECMDLLDIEAVEHQFTAAIRSLGDSHRVYQYLIKRNLRNVEGEDRGRADYLAAKGLYDFSFWMVVISSQLDSADLRRTAEGLTIRLRDAMGAEVQGKKECFAFMRALLNYCPVISESVSLKYDEHIGYYASDSPLEVHREFLRVGDHFARVLTVKDLPPSTSSDLIRSLREIPCEYILASEWKARNPAAAKEEVRKKKSFFFWQKDIASILPAIMGAVNKQESVSVEQDEAAVSNEAQMGRLIKEMEEKGSVIGEFAMTMVLLGETRTSIDTAVVHAMKAISDNEGSLYLERFNALSAWLAVLPGGHKNQHRSMLVTDANYANLSMLFAPDSGRPKNDHLKAGCLTVLETRQRTPYYANLHYGDVGHALISGNTGSGKSYLANWLIEGALERYGARIVIFDIGGSYKQMTEKAGGSYMEIGLDIRINPFSLEENSENRNFLFSFVKVLIEGGGRVMNAIDDEVLFKSIPGKRRLSELAAALPAEMGSYIARWVRDGQYGSLFDNAEDTLTYAKFQTFDFEGLDKYPQILEPLLFYVLHRANVDIYSKEKRDQFKIFLLDEAWKFLLNDTVRSYIYESLKTWRKRNAAMWLSTQSVADLGQAEMLSAIRENCGYLVLLPNPRMDRDNYKKVFRLNDLELDLVATMQPKSESLWKPAVGPSKVVRLDAGKAA